MSRLRFSRDGKTLVASATCPARTYPSSVRTRTASPSSSIRRTSERSKMTTPSRRATRASSAANSSGMHERGRALVPPTRQVGRGVDLGAHARLRRGRRPARCSGPRATRAGAARSRRSGCRCARSRRPSRSGRRCPRWRRGWRGRGGRAARSSSGQRRSPFASPWVRLASTNPPLRPDAAQPIVLRLDDHDARARGRAPSPGSRSTAPCSRRRRSRGRHPSAPRAVATARRERLRARTRPCGCHGVIL